MTERERELERLKQYKYEYLREILATERASTTFFRELLRKPGNARLFCRRLAPSVKRRARMTKMEIMEGRFVDPAMQDIIGDTVLRMPTRPKKGWIYVAILQCCKPYSFMRECVECCHERIHDMHAKSAGDRSPVEVYPIIYYTGRGRPSALTSLEGLVPRGPLGETPRA
ncbi:MAG: Rpn family recombination-promoting nuclease/putative transposase [Myxococcota bacterium]